MSQDKMGMEINAFSEYQLSALAEAGNIGSSHAATALSQLIGRPVMVEVTKVEVFSLKNYPQFFDETHTPLTGIQVQALGNLRGVMLMVMSKASTMTLTNDLFNQTPEACAVMDEMQQSALGEIGTILSSSYLNALGEMAGLNLISSTPRVMFNNGQAIFKTVFEPFHKESEFAIGMETKFIAVGEKSKAHLFFMLGKKGAEVLLDALLATEKHKN